jgi:hypothetical protein
LAEILATEDALEEERVQLTLAEDNLAAQNSLSATMWTVEESEPLLLEQARRLMESGKKLEQQIAELESKVRGERAMKNDKPIYSEYRLLTKGENGPVIRTFRGRALAGTPINSPANQYTIGIGRPVKDEAKWSPDTWFVIQAVSGKLVVYTVPGACPSVDQLGQIRIFADWETMRSQVPPEIYNEAATKAGLIAEPQIPVEPLTEAE